MKNIILFTILLSLTGFAYLSEEKGIWSSQSTVNELYFEDLGQVTALELKNTKLFLSPENDWIVESLEYPANINYIKSLVNVLRKIKIIKKIKLENENHMDYFVYQDLEVKILSGKSSFHFRLGDISQISGQFYIQNLKSKQIYLCEDTSVFEGVYQSELDLAIRKYLKLTSLVDLQPMKYIRKELFSFVDIKNIKSLKINSKRNRWFIVNLESGNTYPKPFSGVGVKNLKLRLQEYLNAVKIIKIHSGKRLFVSNKMSEIDINTSQQKYKGTLFSSLNGKFGRFVKFKHDIRIFEIEPSDKNIFYSNNQNYWKKTFNFGQKISVLKNLDFQLSLSKNHFYKFKIDNLKKFEIEIVGKEVKSFSTNKMNYLFNLVFNLLNFSEAIYIETLSSKQLRKKYPTVLKMKLLGTQLDINIQDTALTVIDKKLRLKYHFAYDRKLMGENVLKNLFQLKSRRTK